MKKVAIVGRGAGWEDAPFKDKSWEIWSLNNLYRNIPRRTRWFDIHDNIQDRPEHRKMLSKLNCPVYVLQECPDIPNSVMYPLEEVKREFFSNVNREQFFANSFSYMIALALYEGFGEIGLFGINQATDTEYGKHLPCSNFWVGVALGRGVKLFVQEHSNIMNPQTLYR